MKRKISIILFIASLLLVLGSCHLFANNPNPLKIRVNGASAKISWESPNPVLNHQILQYNIYIKNHNGGAWTLLEEIQNTKEDVLTFTLLKENIPYSFIDIGIRSVYTSGTMSEIHSSLDDTAEPSCGWYLYWTL